MKLISIQKSQIINLINQNKIIFANKSIEKIMVFFLENIDFNKAKNLPETYVVKRENYSDLTKDQILDYENFWKDRISFFKDISYIWDENFNQINYLNIDGNMINENSNLEVLSSSDDIYIDYDVFKNLVVKRNEKNIEKEVSDLFTYSIVEYKIEKDDNVSLVVNQRDEIYFANELKRSDLLELEFKNLLEDLIKKDNDFFEKVLNYKNQEIKNFKHLFKYLTEDVISKTNIFDYGWLITAVFNKRIVNFGEKLHNDLFCKIANLLLSKDYFNEEDNFNLCLQMTKFLFKSKLVLPEMFFKISPNYSSKNSLFTRYEKNKDLIHFNNQNKELEDSVKTLLSFLIKQGLVSKLITEKENDRFLSQEDEITINNILISIYKTDLIKNCSEEDKKKLTDYLLEEAMSCLQENSRKDFCIFDLKKLLQMELLTHIDNMSIREQVDSIKIYGKKPYYLDFITKDENQLEIKDKGGDLSLLIRKCDVVKINNLLKEINDFCLNKSEKEVNELMSKMNSLEYVIENLNNSVIINNGVIINNEQSQYLFNIIKADKMNSLSEKDTILDFVLNSMFDNNFSINDIDYIYSKIKNRNKVSFRKMITYMEKNSLLEKGWANVFDGKFSNIQLYVKNNTNFFKSLDSILEKYSFIEPIKISLTNLINDKTINDKTKETFIEYVVDKNLTNNEYNYYDKDLNLKIKNLLVKKSLYELITEKSNISIFKKLLNDKELNFEQIILDNIKSFENTDIYEKELTNLIEAGLGKSDIEDIAIKRAITLNINRNNIRIFFDEEKNIYLDKFDKRLYYKAIKAFEENIRDDNGQNIICKVKNMHNFFSNFNEKIRDESFFDFTLVVSKEIKKSLSKMNKETVKSLFEELIGLYSLLPNEISTIAVDKLKDYKMIDDLLSEINLAVSLNKKDYVVRKKKL